MTIEKILIGRYIFDSDRFFSPLLLLKILSTSKNG